MHCSDNKLHDFGFTGFKERVKFAKPKSMCRFFCQTYVVEIDRVSATSQISLCQEKSRNCFLPFFVFCLAGQPVKFCSQNLFEPANP